MNKGNKSQPMKKTSEETVDLFVSKQHGMDNEGRYRDKMQGKLEDEVGRCYATWIPANRNERDGFR